MSKITGKNSQQLLMIQGMFGIKQATPIRIAVKEKRENIPCDLVVIPSGDFVVYKTIVNNDESLWSSWESPEEVERWFRVCSLL